MKRAGVWFIGLFLLGGLVVISPGTFAIFLPLDSPASSDRSTAGMPADSDEPADSAAAGTDCARSSRWLEADAPLPTLSRVVLRVSDRHLFRLAPVAHRMTSLTQAWRFLQRAAAAPRAPTCIR